MEELIVNLHMHTRYSDGFGTHAEIAQAGLKAGLDAVIVTDHNLLVRGPEGYYKDGNRRLLMLVGQELHDQARLPQKDHLLALGCERDLATFADDPQRLIDAVRQADGAAFLAHPFDPACPPIKQTDISWESWQVSGYAGLEVWNALSELKIRSRTILHVLFYVFNPRQLALMPHPQVLAKWDALLSEGRRVAAVGGSDAHAIPVGLGPIRRVVYPYEFHFRAINTHVLTSEPLSGDLSSDRRLLTAALRRGSSFVGYDLPAPTRGFRFTAQGQKGSAGMGDEISLGDGVTLQIRLPQPTECRLVHNGQVLKTWRNHPTCTYIANAPGAYRVEAYIPYLGRRRGWIFSNPIYVR